MAGGIDWFRWHHGTVTDPKFRVVARKAGARVGDVLAVWALVLERSSASDNRGHPGALDMETVEEAFGLADGDAQRIYDAMVARGLIDASTGRIARWEARQPKREDNSTERSRQHRERKRQASQDAASPDVGNAVQRTATRGNARGEESREEEIGASIPAEDALRAHDAAAAEPPAAPPTAPAPAATPVAPGVAGMLCRRLKAMGIGNVNPGNLRLDTLLKAGAQPEEFVAAAPKALSANDPFAYLLGIVEGERIRAADVAKRVHQGPMPTAPPAPGSFAERRDRQLTVAAVLTGVQSPKAPAPAQPVEVIDGQTRLLS